MKRMLLPVAIVVALAIAAGGFLMSRKTDRFDYEAAFETAPPSGAAGGVRLDLKTFAGRTRNEVRQVLGEPQRCEPAEFSERCRYGGLGVEITYIGDKADWITVPMGYDAYPLLPQTLATLGLPVRDPDEVSEHENIWHDLAGYREVRLVGGDQGAIYARIKVATR
ncbi:hypothetical protein [Solimonas flava]|uniref:hypothetical protein n=1 Tax=Solimonas flava TaxID=415849 RepID=UPI0012B62B4A|nr:hypothetical protein [Solimonas flava]